MIQTTKPYSILKPVESPHRPPVDPADVLVAPTAGDIEALRCLAEADVIVVDLETRGADFTAPGSAIVGLGLAWRRGTETGAKYFNWTLLNDTARGRILAYLALASGVVTAFNLMFDGAWIWRECQRIGVPEPAWTHCAYGLLRQLATEDFPGQSWSLKQAQLDLLGWEETNEVGIEEWLIGHGYHKQGPKLQEGESPETHLAACAAWVSENPEKRHVAADKSEMWRVPPAILGEYCILDCLSTLQLLDEVLWPALEAHPELEEWHREYFPAIDRLLWTQQAAGIRLDRAAMEKHGEFLRAQMVKAEALLRESSVATRISNWEFGEYEKLRLDHAAKEPARFNKKRERQEPEKFKKNGEVSKNWLKWQELESQPPVQSKAWENWEARGRAIQGPKFNLGSDEQRRWLLYGDPHAPGPIKWRPTGKTRGKKKGQIRIEVPIYEIEGVNGWVELEGTDAGLLPTSGDLVSQLPADVRAPLQLYSDAEQELGYVDSYLTLARDHGGEWRVHPGWISPGTKTGRLAGKDPNLQQAPKTIEFLRTLVADPGHVWVEMDWSSLEPHVLAEISRDPALLHLYGPEAKKHDVYLYSGAHYAVLGDEIRPHYDLSSPDVGHAKKMCKEVREACKVVVLAKSYGAGAANIWSGLRLRGFKLTPEQAAAISESHDEMYAASGKRFHKLLEGEWRTRGGWILSGLGHPIAVHESKKKDLINRLCQKTGHDVHTTFVVRVSRRLEQEGIQATGVVWDFHDQLIFQVREELGEKCLQILRDEVQKLNEYLGAYVRLKGDPKLSRDMAHAKEAEFSWEAAHA
jgi:hypothetical protein